MRRTRLLGAAGILLIALASALARYGVGPLLVALGSVAHGETSSSVLIELQRWVSPWQVPDPEVAWPLAQPDAVGLDGAALERLRADVAEAGTVHLLAARGGYLAYEWSRPGADPHARRFVAAGAKCTVGALALLHAAELGLLRLDDPAARFIPAWRDDPVRSRITLRQLANHTSGLQNVGYGPNGQLSGWEQEYSDRRDRRFPMTLARAQLLAAPGSRIEYSSPAYYALSYALAVALRDAGQPDLHDFLERRVMQPLGIPRGAWEISYGESYRQDGLRLYTLASGADFTPRAWARLGQLLLRRGPVDRRVLSDAGRAALLSDAALPPETPAGQFTPGLGWSLNTRGAWPSLPEDAAACEGSLDQILLVVPSLELVMVRMGEGWLAPEGPGHDAALDARLFAPLVRAVRVPPRLAGRRGGSPRR